MNTELDNAISLLAKQASTSNDSNDAMRYSQAALNLANTKRSLADSVFDPARVKALIEAQKG